MDSVLTFQHPHEGLLHELFNVVANQAAEEADDGRRVALEKLIVHEPRLPEFNSKPGAVDEDTSMSARADLEPLMNTHHPITRPSLVLAAWLVATCLLSNSAAACPLLPDLPGPDIVGMADITIHLNPDTPPIVEADELCYALDRGMLELPIDSTLLVVVPRGSALLVFVDGWTQELVPSFTSEFLAADVFVVSVSLTEADLGIAVVDPGQRAPTVPDLVIRPKHPDPT